MSDQSQPCHKEKVKTVYFSTRTSPNLEDLPCELVSGDGHIHEELLGLKFRISPHSFFQVTSSISPPQSPQF